MCVSICVFFSILFVERVGPINTFIAEAPRKVASIKSVKCCDFTVVFNTVALFQRLQSHMQMKEERRAKAGGLFNVLVCMTD